MTPYYHDARAGITIWHGDVLDVLPHLSGIGAVVTDPPYSSGGAFRGDRAMKTLAKYVHSNSSGQDRLQDFGGDTRDQRGYFAWSALWMTAAYRASLPGAVLCCFTDWRQLPVTTDAVQAGGWVWRNIATWHKPGIRMQRGLFSASAEYVVFGVNGQPIDHDGAPQNVFAFSPIQTANKQHIAEKPVEVMGWILRVVPAGAVVCDPFMGSGTTLRAAKDNGHPIIGIEADERYCEIAAKRLAQEVLFPVTP